MNELFRISTPSPLKHKYMKIQLMTGSNGYFKFKESGPEHKSFSEMHQITQTGFTKVKLPLNRTECALPIKEAHQITTKGRIPLCL